MLARPLLRHSQCKQGTSHVSSTARLLQELRGVRQAREKGRREGAGTFDHRDSATSKLDLNCKTRQTH